MSLNAVWVPGLPHILKPESSTQWLRCAKAMEKLGETVKAEGYDRIVLYSTQWLSVLGTSFQAQPEPNGVHVDENWYALGDLPFRFRCDADLASIFAAGLKAEKLPSKTVSYEGFPIDTATIVALRFLNPDGKIPVNLVSSWVYANADTSKKIGTLMRDAVRQDGKKTLFVATSLLSSRFFTKEIDPQADAIAMPSDDDWNRRILGLWEKGELREVTSLSGAYVKEAKADMQFNAFHWLHGVLGDEKVNAKVVHYGPLWGTGAAVVEFHGNA